MALLCSYPGCVHPAHGGGHCAQHERVALAQLAAPRTTERFAPRAMLEPEQSEVTVGSIMRRVGKRRSPVA
jgi:hypothetical protein